MLALCLVVLINALAQNICAKNIDFYETDVTDQKNNIDISFRTHFKHLFANSLSNNHLNREKRQLPSSTLEVIDFHNTSNEHTTIKSNQNLNQQNVDPNRPNGLPRNNKKKIFSVQTFMPRFNRTRFGNHLAGRNVLKPGHSNTKASNKTVPNQDLNHSDKHSSTILANEKDQTTSNVYDVTIKPYAPGFLPIPEFNGPKASNKTNKWYENFNVISEVFGLNSLNSTDNGATTTEMVLSGCNICSGTCPIGTHRSGLFCISNDYDY